MMRRRDRREARARGVVPSCTASICAGRSPRHRDGRTPPARPRGETRPSCAGQASAHPSPRGRRRRRRRDPKAGTARAVGRAGLGLGRTAGCAPRLQSSFALLPLLQPARAQAGSSGRPCARWRPSLSRDRFSREAFTPGKQEGSCFERERTR